MQKVRASQCVTKYRLRQLRRPLPVITLDTAESMPEQTVTAECIEIT